jgi:hypothetical protein
LKATVFLVKSAPNVCKWSTGPTVFKQQCEKSDASLRQYINTLDLQTVSLQNESNIIISDMKADQLFGSSEVLQQSSIFQDIFNDATSHSLVDNFTNQNASTGI